MVHTLIDLYINPKTYDNVTIGNFDGVHLGHQKLLNELKKNNENNLVIIISKSYNNLNNSYDNINKIDEYCKGKVDILNVHLEGVYQNITHVTFKDFLKKLKIKKIYIGEDFKFGYKQLGNIEYLKEFFEVGVVEHLKEENIKVSTSTIKEYVSQGLILKANNLLGHEYFISGKVVKGNQIGRTISFPTLNITSNTIYPKYGVYKSRISILGHQYKSITNIGIRPTINSTQCVIETHILDEFNIEAYGEEIYVYLIDFIREEQKFNGLDELKEQIQKDIEVAKR